MSAFESEAIARLARRFQMRYLKYVALIGLFMVVAGSAHAQVAVRVGPVFAGTAPVCQYGYYGYSPYACAPYGYYGPGYFYNGIFIGMGPWGGWGCSHGWGSHRFVNDGGGSYRGGPGGASYRTNSGPARGNAPAARSNGAR